MRPAWTAARRIDPPAAIPGVIVLKEFRADLHIHTCLSPCADWEMSPAGSSAGPGSPAWT